MCWFIRRIQPLQHRTKFMHEYTSDRRDSLRISMDNFSSDSVKIRLKDIVKVKDKKRGFTITYDMYIDDKCPKVGIYFSVYDIYSSSSVLQMSFYLTR